MKSLKPFIFGILAAAGALIIELVISNLYFILSGKDVEINYFDKITFFLVIVVLIEESFKYVMLRKSYKEQDRKKQKISTAVIAGLGFASVELFFIYLSMFFNQSSFYFDLGIIGALALHIATTGIIGYLIVSEKSAGTSLAIKTIGIAFCLHIIYNLAIIYNLNYLVIYSYLIALFLVLVLLSHKYAEKNP